jgi:hypothetical protein
LKVNVERLELELLRLSPKNVEWLTTLGSKLQKT